MTRQSVFSVNRYPMNLSYINSRASINNIYIKELLTRLVKLNRTLKIHNGDEPIHILQIRSQRHLMLPISTCHYSENIIPNVSLVARFVNEYHTIYITSKMTMQYVQNKEYGEHIQFPRDHKFNLYYMGINEADMDKYYCPDTLKQALDFTSIIQPTIYHGSLHGYTLEYRSIVCE